MSQHTNNTTHAEPEEKLFSVIGEFDDVDSVMSAAEQVRDAGYTRWDVHAPFPIHGIDRAMGIRPTILPWITLGGGLLGMAGGVFLVWWTNATTAEIPGLPTVLQGYQYLISGKPIFSLPANIPIIFETTVLLAAFSTVIGMFALNGLPMLYHPLFKSDRFRRVTNDRFYVVIDAVDPLFDERRTSEFLVSIGARAIEKVTD